MTQPIADRWCKNRVVCFRAPLEAVLAPDMDKASRE
jgi:hypothetical protein